MVALPHNSPLRVMADIVDITEHRPCPYPLVYGYLRIFGTGASRRGALQNALHEYCAGHELAFGGLFTDDVPPTEPIAVGFADLMDVLADPGVYGVVMPAGNHLGRGSLATKRRSQIARTGRRLLLLRSGRWSKTSTNALATRRQASVEQETTCANRPWLTQRS